MSTNVNQLKMNSLKALDDNPHTNLLQKINCNDGQNNLENLFISIKVLISTVFYETNYFKIILCSIMVSAMQIIAKLKKTANKLKFLSSFSIN